VAPPLEKVIEHPDHLRALLQMPELYRNSVGVIEPWPNVGTNPRGEQVRASKNVAYVLQQIADADTILYPVWRSGIENAERLANVLSAGIATIVQGGNPRCTIRAASTAPTRPRGNPGAGRPVAAAPLAGQRAEHLHLPRPPARGGLAHPADPARDPRPARPAADADGHGRPGARQPAEAVCADRGAR